MDSIALSDLRVVTPWPASRSGTLLRVFVLNQGQLVTGIRCRAFNKECIVALEGDAYGRLITEEGIAGTALDVSNLFELATSADLLPPTREHAQTNVGVLYLCARQYWLHFQALQGQDNGFVCVYASDPAQVGDVMEQLATEILAKVASVELRHRAKAIPVLPVR
jgi:hypothetical protein